MDKDFATQKHNLGITQKIIFAPGDLVLLYDQKESGKKLQAKWRGPFVITGFGGDIERSYIIRQIDGIKITRHYHGDFLKKFRLRKGYLRALYEEEPPIYQNIRLERAVFKVPKAVRTIRGKLSGSEEAIRIRGYARRFVQFRDDLPLVFRLS